MATNPKLKPCPCCGSIDQLDVYKYESGWCHVECNRCHYLGPGKGSIRQAIKSHNAHSEEQTRADAARYRYLRGRPDDMIGKGGVFAGMTPSTGSGGFILTGCDLDRAVDGAMAAELAGQAS